MKVLIHADEAKTIISKHLRKFSSAYLPIKKCAGRTLRQDIISDRPLPPFNRSMMDGYALRFSDIAKVNSFNVTAVAAAGSQQITLNNKAGSCIEIMTGAVVPNDADIVVPYEETEYLNDSEIRILPVKNRDVGSAIHPIGSDHDSNEVLVDAGCIIGSREIAIAATCGYSKLKISNNPSIAVVTTGDELVSVSETPKSYQNRRSNDLSIVAALDLSGYHVMELTHLYDDRLSLKASLIKLTESYEIVIISGGISKGKKDFIPGVLDEIGLVCQFHGVAQKPGKPFGFWSNDLCSVFALPGNPQSTLTCLHQYVLPALRAASGNNINKNTCVDLLDATTGIENMTTFLPVSVTAENKAAQCPCQNSGDLVKILSSDGYIELPPKAVYYPAGSSFLFYPWA
jgi:molybdopterin molybdotransferase